MHSPSLDIYALQQFKAHRWRFRHVSNFDALAPCCGLTNSSQRKQDRWSSSEKKQLTLSLQSDAAMAFLIPENRVATRSGQKWRWKNNVIKDCAIAVQNDLFQRLGLERRSDEDEGAYSSRLWARANVLNCTFLPAEKDETESQYDHRFRRLGRVSDQCRQV